MGSTEVRGASHRGMLGALLVALIVISSAADAHPIKGSHSRGHGPGHGHHGHHGRKPPQHLLPPQPTKTDKPPGVGHADPGSDLPGSYYGNHGGSQGGQLSDYFYSSTCPQLKSVVAAKVQSLVRADNTLPAAWIRVHFHDCFVRGCDASVLINGSDTNSELSARANQGSLRGFLQFESIKEVVEDTCPGVVSCADLLALVARDSIYYTSGAYWRVPMGRRDGLKSSKSEAEAALPSPFFTYDQLVANFKQAGLSEQDMVILSGAHTIGMVHCSILVSRLYNFPNSPDGVDPALDKTYATRLQQECPENGSGANLVPLDPTGGGQTFDNQYFVRVLRNKGTMPSDAALITDPDGERIIEQEAGTIFAPNGRFFYAFGNSMERMGQLDLLTGTQGEIRKHCYAFNSESS